MNFDIRHVDTVVMTYTLDELLGKCNHRFGFIDHEFSLWFVYPDDSSAVCVNDGDKVTDKDVLFGVKCFVDVNIIAVRVKE